MRVQNALAKLFIKLDQLLEIHFNHIKSLCKQNCIGTLHKKESDKWSIGFYFEIWVKYILYYFKNKKCLITAHSLNSRFIYHIAKWWYWTFLTDSPRKGRRLRLAKEREAAATFTFRLLRDLSKFFVLSFNTKSPEKKSNIKYQVKFYEH